MTRAYFPNVAEEEPVPGRRLAGRPGRAGDGAGADRDRRHRGGIEQRDHRHRHQARIRRCRTCPSRSTPRPRRTSSARARPRSRICRATSPASAVQNLGPGQSQVSVRGVSAGQIVRDQPGVKEQVGVYLDEVGDLAVAVHSRHRPVRPQPRRDPARAAGHPVRIGLGRRHHPLHHQPARTSTGSRASVEGNINVVDEGDIGGHLKGAINVPAVGDDRDPGGRLPHPICRLHRCASRGRQRGQGRQ